MPDYSNESVTPRPYVQPNVTVNQTPVTPARSGTPGAGIALIVIAVFVVIAIMWATMSTNDTAVDVTVNPAAPAVTEPAATDAMPAADPAPVVNETTTDPATPAPAPAPAPAP